jgi:hypothetical protein
MELYHGSLIIYSKQYTRNSIIARSIQGENGSYKLNFEGWVKDYLQYFFKGASIRFFFLIDGKDKKFWN